jgi:hypothetical protein
MRVLCAALCLLTLLSGPAHAIDYAEGQVWEYQTRPGEEASLLKIAKVETVEKLGPVFHISLSGLRIDVPRVSDARLTELPHLPVSKQTLDQSVTKLSTAAFAGADFAPGYEEWRRSFDQGRAGVFTISVAQIVGVVEEALNKGSPSVKQ